MRILVFGTGALGTLFTARLVGAGASVAVTGTWPEALAALAADGATIDDGTAAFSVAVEVVPRAELAGVASFDLALVLVKSRQTPEVAPLAAAAVGGEGLAVTLQNGLGSYELLRQAAGAERAAAGVSFVGAMLLGPGRVRPAGGNHVVLGGPASATGRLEKLAALLRRAGFGADVTADLERERWMKLAINCAINPLGALLGVPNGELAGEAWRTLTEEIAREAGRVASARGIDLGADPGERVISGARMTAGNVCSMLQDVRGGRLTEIDDLNGRVVDEGRELGVDVPLNARLAAWIRRVEAGEDVPTSVALREELEACRS